jgi:hypothetical protein
MDKNKELKHVGVLGMKWGRRKSEGTGSSTKAKSVSQMTNDELKTHITRLSLEKQYKELKPSTLSSGRKFLADVLIQATKPVLVAQLAVGFGFLLKKAVDYAKTK